MKMIKMKYRDFEFEVIPSEVSMKLTKNISKTDFANHGEKCEEINKKGALISGKGYFVGEDAMNKAYALIRVFNKKGSDFLFTPFCNPKKMLFTSLEIHYSASNSRVEYSFEFTQDGFEKNEVYDFGYTVALEGENLFDVSSRTGVEVQRLVSLNDFGDLFAVKEGDRVWLI